MVAELGAVAVKRVRPPKNFLKNISDPRFSVLAVDPCQIPIPLKNDSRVCAGYINTTRIPVYMDGVGGRRVEKLVRTEGFLVIFRPVNQRIPNLSPNRVVTTLL